MWLFKVFSGNCWPDFCGGQFSVTAEPVITDDDEEEDEEPLLLISTEVLYLSSLRADYVRALRALQPQEEKMMTSSHSPSPIELLHQNENPPTDSV